jgi:radical SAM protein with 4Fe4S-binding SPASM domain
MKIGKTLPDDCTLLPVTGGMLLVSRGHAVFCRVPDQEIEAIGCVLSGRQSPDDLGDSLLDSLREHGFFGPPRAAAAEVASVQIQVTNECNLACAYCCTNSGSPRTNETTLAKLLSVVRQIPEVLGPNTGVALLGGEPLLVPWVVQLAHEILALGLKLTIFTNGVRLADDQCAEQVATLVRRGAKVRVSLGGPDAATCDAISGGVRFHSSLLGIQKLAELGAQVSVDLMMMPQNVNTIVAEVGRLRERLPDRTPLALGVLYRSGREGGEHLFPSRAELEAELDRIAFEAGVSIPAAERGPVMDRRDGCVCAAGKQIHIRSDGTLFRCFKMEEQVGHLDTIGFVAAAQALRGRPRRASDSPVCAECALASLCGGGCRSENLLYTGCADIPPCGAWRVRVLSELLAEDRIAAVEWPVAFLLDEARRRGIPIPSDVLPRVSSRHLVEV